MSSDLLHGTMAGFLTACALAAAIVHYRDQHRPARACTNPPKTTTTVETISTPALSLQDGIWTVQRSVRITQHVDTP